MTRLEIALHRLLRRALPARIRELRGADMEATFFRMLECEGKTWRGRTSLWIKEVGDLLATGVRLRWAQRQSRSQSQGRGRWRLSAPGFSLLDVKVGLRMLWKHPGLTLVAAVTLVVRIPIGLVPSHVANAFEVAPPVDEGDRLLMLRHINSETTNVERPSLYDFLLWCDELTSFDVLGAARSGSYNVLSGSDRAAPPVRGAIVTASMFDILRLPPLLGRTLAAADEEIGAPAVAVIGYDLWQTRLGGALDVVGKPLRIGGVGHTVVGVMPQGFLFPHRDHLWVPLRARAVEDNHASAGSPWVFGRLADGSSPENAEAELVEMGARMTADLPETHARLRPQTVPFTTGFFGLPKGGFRALPEFYWVQLLTLLLLVVPCANIGMLVLARTANRSRELAVRTALGASRTRIILQLFTESLVLAVLAAGAGLAIGNVVANRTFGWLLELVPFWIDLGVTSATVL